LLWTMQRAFVGYTALRSIPYFSGNYLSV